MKSFSVHLTIEYSEWLKTDLSLSDLMPLSGFIAYVTDVY